MDTAAAILITLLLSPLVAGEIRHTEIRADDHAAILLDRFFFVTTGGQLELNITRLSFLLPVPRPASLSKIGFVLLPPDSWNHMSTQTCAFEYPDAHKVLTLDQIPPASAEWDLLLPSPANYREYLLVFANCLSQEAKVSMNVRSAMYNRRGKPTTVHYLTGGPIVPIVYFLFTLIYLVLAVHYGIVVAKLTKRLQVSMLHYCMLATLLLKALNMYCEAMKKLYIDQTGSATRWWDAWFYTSSFFRSISFYAVTLMIGYTQWQQLSRVLPGARGKMILLALITLQLVANAARVLLVDKSGLLYDLGDTWWLCVSAILNLVSIWLLECSFQQSVKEENLRMGVGTHNRKNAHNDDVVSKTFDQLFHHYFNVTKMYLIFGPTLEFILPVQAHSYKLCWIYVVALELVTLAFYVSIGCLFTPSLAHIKGKY